MELNWLQFMANVATSLVAAFASALLAVHYSLKRFYSEKQWERKADAYASLLEALHRMKTYSVFHMKYEMRGSEPPEDQQKELVENFLRAHAEVLKRADIGTFAISDEAVSALRGLERGLAESQNVQGWWAHLQLENDAVDRCLASIREIAKKDLGFHK